MKIEVALYEEIKDITKNDYNVLVNKEPEEPVLIFSEEIEKILEDLIKEIKYKDEVIDDLTYRIERLNDKLKDLEKDLEDNFRRIPIGKQVNISDKDFI